MQDKTCLSKAVCLAHLYKVYQLVTDLCQSFVLTTIIRLGLDCSLGSPV